MPRSSSKFADVEKIYAFSHLRIIFAFAHLNFGTHPILDNNGGSP